MPTPKPKTPVGPAAVKMLQKQVSPAGVKKKAVSDKKATDKKYPGLYTRPVNRNK